MPLFDDLASNMHLLLIAAAIVATLTVIRRIPVLRTLVNLAITFGLVAMLLVTLHQRQRFDPWLSDVTSFLNIDEQRVDGDTTRIRMATDGHFWARVTVNGVERRMLIDSGATITALSEDTAAAAGLRPKNQLFPVVLRTANGPIQAQTAEVRQLRLGDIEARGLAVVVSPAFGDADVIGMNFLSRLKGWRVAGKWLILEPHHPQPAP